MKNIIKSMLITAIAAMVLTGCGMNTIRENGNSYVEEISTSATIDESVNSYEESNIVNEDSSSNVAKPENTSSENVSSSTNKPVENPVESSTTTNNSTSSTVEEKPTSSSTNKPVSSSSTKIEEKPISSSSTSSSSINKPTSSSTSSSSINKPVEKPIHTHTFTEATCTNPATCISCGETKGTTINHNYNNGSCIYCGKNDPNYVAPHNCKNDGHIWNNSYTESSTENVEIVENHTLSENGYDIDLAIKYFGLDAQNVDFTPYFGTNAFGAGSSDVKTTGVKTITRFIHECSECGYQEVYNTEETVIPDDNWVFVGGSLSKNDYCSVIWYDINNIPDEVYKGVENLLADREAWKNSLRNSR